MLPFDKLNPTDKAIIDSLKAQNDNLREQTKILHTISDEIFKGRRPSSNKENKDIQKELFKLGSGISEIKSYLSGKGKGATGASFGGRAQPDKGFFTNLFSKVFGPSKYQQKMMEEISALRDITERQARSIDFIARQNTDSKRAIERDKLAEAIVRRMSLLDMGGGASGGLLSGFGKALLAGIVGAVSLLSSTLMSGFKSFLSGFDKIIDAIKLLASKFPKLPGSVDIPDGKRGGSPGTPGGLPPNTNKEGGAGKPGGRTGSGGRSSGPLLEGPKRGAPFDPNYKSRFPWNTEKYGPQVEDAKGVRSSGSRFNPSGGRAAIAGLLGALGLNYFMSEINDPQNEDFAAQVRKNLPGGGVRNTSKLFGSPFSGSGVKSVFGDFPFSASRDLAPGESFDVRSKMGDIRYIDDPDVPGRKITQAEYARRIKARGGVINGQTLSEGQMAKVDEAIKREQEIKEQKIKEEKLRLEYDEKENLSLFNKILEDANKALDEFADKFDLFNSKEKIRQTLNALGEIEIQGQKINLAPGLGNAILKTMEDASQLTEELTDTVTEKVNKGISIINNNSNNVVGGDSGKGSVTVQPNAASPDNGSKNINEFMRRHGLIK